MSVANPITATRGMQILEWLWKERERMRALPIVESPVVLGEEVRCRTCAYALRDSYEAPCADCSRFVAGQERLTNWRRA